MNFKHINYFWQGAKAGGVARAQANSCT